MYIAVPIQTHWLIFDPLKRIKRREYAQLQCIVPRPQVKQAGVVQRFACEAIRRPVRASHTERITIGCLAPAFQCGHGVIRHAMHAAQAIRYSVLRLGLFASRIFIIS